MAWFSSPRYSTYMWHLWVEISQCADCTLLLDEQYLHIVQYKCSELFLDFEESHRPVKFELLQQHCEPTLLTNGVVSHIFAFTPWLRYAVIFGSRAVFSQNCPSKTVWGCACWTHSARRKTSNCIWLAYAILLRVSNFVIVLQWPFSRHCVSASPFSHMNFVSERLASRPRGRTGRARSSAYTSYLQHRAFSLPTARWLWLRRT